VVADVRIMLMPAFSPDQDERPPGPAADPEIRTALGAALTALAGAATRSVR